MSDHCTSVVISDKAFNAIVREAYSRHPVETGGILLGYILNNGAWVVMEMIPPGAKGVFETAYFEYDPDFVNYLGTSVANQYREPLQVLGLWHRHPGSMDYFSSTDDGTNADFAARNPYGVISGLVNIDPDFRLTMYHLDHGAATPKAAYRTVEVAVGDDIIPERFFALRYVGDDHELLQTRPGTTASQTGAHDVPRLKSDGRAETEQRPQKLDARRWGLRAPGLIVALLSAVAVFAGGFLLGRAPDAEAARPVVHDTVTVVRRIIVRPTRDNVPETDAVASTDADSVNHKIDK